jgi:glucose-6-phosphate isomerase
MEQADIKETVESVNHNVCHINVHSKSFSITEVREFFHCALFHIEHNVSETVSIPEVCLLTFSPEDRNRMSF